MEMEGYRYNPVPEQKKPEEMEHYKPYVPNAIEQMSIDAWNNHKKSYGYLQQQETLRLLKEQEERDKKAQERKNFT